MKLIKFQAAWCNPCKQLTKTMDAMDIRVPIDYVDIDVNTDVALTYGIRSIPTLVLVDENENQLRRLTGASTKEQIQEFLGEYA